MEDLELEEDTGPMRSSSSYDGTREGPVDGSIEIIWYYGQGI